jgi:putative hydrolase of HD superfamily
MKLDELLGKLGGLKEIPRTGWLFAGVPLENVENVAEHSFEVSTITLLLLDELQDSGVKLDREQALTMALTHDWPEALVADFPYTALKYLDPQNTKGKMEEKALSELLGGREKYLNCWREYRDEKTPESRLVHAADYLSMLLQAIRYRERGNCSLGIGELWKAVLRDLEPYLNEFPPVRGLVEELRLFWARQKRGTESKKGWDPRPR